MPMAIAVSRVRAIAGQNTVERSHAMTDLARQGAPSADTCDPLLRASPFLVYEWRLISIVRIDKS